MKNILTGVQSSGRPHLGNIVGAINPIIELSKRDDNLTIGFIANMHSLTSITDPKVRLENTYAVAATFLALGFDTQKNILFKQSDLPQVGELSFYLSCVTPYPMLANAHSFKDKTDNLSEVNAGLFTYPVLMASDILLYDTDLVPVGKDQVQHLEMTRDIAMKFNKTYGNTFKLPSAIVSESTMILPGIDGRKMSKSYNNYIDPFEDEKKLRKKINRIITSSCDINDPKDPETCNVFKIYSAFGSKDQIESLTQDYLDGIPFSSAKGKLFDLIMETFKDSRIEYQKISKDKSYIDSVLLSGSERLSEKVNKKMTEIKTKLGL